MDRVEVITRVERRRKWSEAEKAAVLAETDAPGTNVAAVARKHGIARSVVYNWRSARRAQAIAAMPGAGPALAAIRAILLTGFRRMEVLGLHREWVRAKEHCICFPDTKTGGQVRIIGRAAVDLLEAQPTREESPFLFPADWGDGHFIGVVRVLDRVCAKAKLQGVTPHVLRHTFASIAAELGFTEMTIAGLLGQHARLQRFVVDDAAVDVGAVHDVVRTGVTIVAAQGIAAATASAEQQAGEKRARPVYAVQLGSWC